MTDFDDVKFNELAKRVVQLEQNLLNYRDELRTLKTLEPFRELRSLKEEVGVLREAFKKHLAAAQERDDEVYRGFEIISAQIREIWERVDPMFEAMFPGTEQTLRRINKLIGVDIHNPAGPDPHTKKPS